MMRVEFRGFGLNLPTLLLAVLLATLVGLAPQTFVGRTSSNTASAAVYPCKPSYWRTRTVTNYKFTASGIVLYERANIQFNGCDVKLAGPPACWHGPAFIYAIDVVKCDAYRLYTYTAYGQQLVVRSQFKIGVGATWGPFTIVDHLCRAYNRWGQVIWTKNNLWDSGC